MPLPSVIDERRNVYGYIKELCVQRDELNQEIQGEASSACVSRF